MGHLDDSKCHQLKFDGEYNQAIYSKDTIFCKVKKYHKRNVYKKVCNKFNTNKLHILIQLIVKSSNGNFRNQNIPAYYKNSMFIFIMKSDVTLLILHVLYLLWKY